MARYQVRGPHGTVRDYAWWTVVDTADRDITTDTARKEADRSVELSDGTTVTVGGMAKGAAMLAPSMATMLVALTTDAAVEPRTLHELVAAAVDGSFHELSMIASCVRTE